MSTAQQRIDGVGLVVRPPLRLNDEGCGCRGKLGCAGGACRKSLTGTARNEGSACCAALVDIASGSPTSTASTSCGSLSLLLGGRAASLPSLLTSPYGSACDGLLPPGETSAAGMSKEVEASPPRSAEEEPTALSVELALPPYGERPCRSQCERADSFNSRNSGPLDLLGTEPEPDATPLLAAANLPEQIVDLEYAVRGPVVNRAEEIANEIQSNPGCKPFDKIIRANIGNPQAVGQLPITFNRQVLACLLSPPLLDAKASGTGEPLYPSDVVARARRYLESIPGIGAYSHSKGVLLFRQDIAQWVAERDGFPCDPESIMMTDGASSAIRLTLELLISKPSDGILIPVPQYPLYSASITRLRGTAVEYYLKEDDGWSLDVDCVEAALQSARHQGVDVRGLVLINPGNPTGAVMTRRNLEAVIRFCKLHGLVLLADEVYQSNIYAANRTFVSAREVVLRSNSGVQLFSFHSASKGLWGECGLRGGLLQMENVSPEVQALLYKLFCVQLCSNTVGQALMTLLLTPPKPGDPSFEASAAEADSILSALKRKAVFAEQRLNRLPQIHCQPIMGAMYAFPRIWLPRRACEAAAQQHVEPDYFYCMELLEQTGIVCVPGSGFSQAPGTYHFRITILPHEKLFEEMLDRLGAFHNRFLETYADRNESGLPHS